MLLSEKRLDRHSYKGVLESISLASEAIAEGDGASHG
jgi:hypothetical protein